MKKHLLIIFAALAAMLCSCGGPTADVSDDASHMQSDVSSVDTSSAGDVSTSFEYSAPPADKNQEYFFEEQAYTDYFDVVLRTYDNDSKTHYTDRYGLALPNREIITPCMFETYCQPVVVAEKAVEKRFISKYEGKAVIINDEGDILNTDDLSTVTFPSTLNDDLGEVDINKVLGVAVLPDGGGSVLISSDGKISTEPFDSISFVGNMFYSCEAGSQKYALDINGTEKGRTGVGYSFVKLLADGFTVVQGSSGFGVSDSDGKIALNEFPSDAFQYSSQLEIIVYTRRVGTAEAAEIYGAKTHELITSAYSRVKFGDADQKYAIAYFEYDDIQNIGSGTDVIPQIKTKTLCRLIGKNGLAVFKESFADCEFIDETTLQVKNDDGSVSEVFIEQLTKLDVSDKLMSVLANLDTELDASMVGNRKVAFADVNGDGKDELIVRCGISENGAAVIFSADGTQYMQLYGSISLKKGYIITECNEKGSTVHIYDLSSGECTTLIRLDDDGETVYGVTNDGRDAHYITKKADGRFADQNGDQIAVEMITESEYDRTLSGGTNGATALAADFFRY